MKTHTQNVHRELRQERDIVATNTLHKYIFLWNTNLQIDRELLPNCDPSAPELILKGHKKDSTNGLDCSIHCPEIVSVSKD